MRKHGAPRNTAGNMAKTLTIHLQPHLVYTPNKSKSYVLINGDSSYVGDLCLGCAFYGPHGLEDKKSCLDADCAPDKVDAEKNYVWKRLL